MKTHTVPLVTVVLIAVVLAVIGILKITPALAQTIATSSDIGSSTDTTTPTVLEASTSTDTTTSDAPTTAAPQPTTLTLVHVVGTKYTDYFTDGTTTIAVTGDPKIDSNFNKPDAPIPTRPGMTWVRTTGTYLYDTQSGDLEVGNYALADGGFIVHYAASTYTDATSTTAWPDRIVSGLPTDPVTGAAAPTIEPPTTDTTPASDTDSAPTPIPEATSSTSGSVLGAPTSVPTQDTGPSSPTSASSSDITLPASDASTPTEPAPSSSDASSTTNSTSTFTSTP